MSSNPSFNAPVLNYVGSVDIASATSGTTLYNISFDSSLCTIGNVLMFEYKIQPSDGSAPEPDNITLGYVNMESAIFTSGILNQWTIAIPAADNIYNPTISREITVRVYSGLTGTTEIAVSQWSNALDVHVPPPQPEIEYSYFDQNSYLAGDDDLWVFMKPDLRYNYAEVQFIVAYYFQDANTSDTVWSVSDPLYATDISNNFGQYKQLKLENIGDVDTYTNKVYVGVYAVFPFVYNYENYYSVSEISTTATAVPAENFTAPTITDISYGVYATPSTQTMTVNWTAPPVAMLPNFSVDRYVLQLSVNSGTWSTIFTSTSSSTLSYAYDVSSYSCETNLAFRVYAVFQNTSNSDYSNVEALNIFKYATAPTNVVTAWASADEYNTIMDIACSFVVANPYNAGCGEIIHWKLTVTDPSDNVLATKYEDYVAGKTEYLVFFNNVTYSLNGRVNVLLQTADTNNSYVTRDGAVTYGTFTASSLPIIDNVDIDETRTVLTFVVISQTLLAPVAIFAWVTYDPVNGIVRHQKAFYTNDVTPTTLENGVYEYSFTGYDAFTPASFALPNIPNNLMACVSNEAGITVYNVANSSA